MVNPFLIKNVIPLSSSLAMQRGRGDHFQGKHSILEIQRNRASGKKHFLAINEINIAL